MSDVRQARAADPGHAGRRREPTGWVGWIVFSGLLMIMIGVFQAIMGFVALFKEDYYLVGREGQPSKVDQGILHSLTQHSGLVTQDFPIGHTRRRSY